MSFLLGIKTALALFNFGSLDYGNVVRNGRGRPLLNLRRSSLIRSTSS